MQLRQASEDEAKRVRASIDSLKEHRVNIDDGFLQVRALIAQEAKVPLEALPFAGELMEVPLEFREWTGAIERLLRGFGLSLLVSERNYDAVTRAINRRHWGVRLQYFRVPADAPRDAGRQIKGGRLVADRLAFREGHALSPWVAAEVRRAFPHVCCADETELAREPYAITREGLMRSGTRHVKDDRRHVDDASSYVLGWSVEDKLRALSKRLIELQGAVSDAAAKAAEAGREVTRLERQLASVDALVAVAVFDTIDLVSAQRAILKLRSDYEELEKSSDRRKQLKKQLGEVERALKERREALDALQSSLGKNESVTDVNAGRLRVVEEELGPHGDLSFAEYGEIFAELRDGAAPILEKLDAQREGAEKRLRGRVDRQNAIVRESLKEMLPAMTAFLGEYRDFEKSLSPKEEFAADFVALLNRVEREELPAHKNRFEEYLNTNLVGNMAMFNSRLDEQLDAMRSRIGETGIVVTQTGVQWFPWRGTKVIRTLELFARKDGVIPSVDQLSLTYPRWDEVRLRQHLGTIAGFSDAPTDLSDLMASKCFEKFDSFVQPHLLNVANARDRLDIAGARSLAGNFIERTNREESDPTALT